MSTIGIEFHISRALDFFDRTDVYVGIGRTTPWPDEDNPPTEAYDDDLEEVIGYKLVESRYLVIPDENGTIEYRGSKYKIVEAVNAITEGAKWVYIKAEIKYDELPLTSFRQIGVFSRLVKEGAVPPGQKALLPAEVTDHGCLEVIDNRKVIHRQIDQKDVVSLIIEF